MVGRESTFVKAGHLVALLVMLAFAAGACAEEEVKQPPTFDKPEGAESRLSKKVKKRRNQKGMAVEDYQANPEWDMLVPHFSAFVVGLEEEVESKSVAWKYKDAFASRVEKWYPPEPKKKSTLNLTVKKTDVKKDDKKNDKTIQSILDGILPPDALKEDGGSDVAGDGTPDDPLTLLPLQKYSFRIIMTGVSNPEVLVEDPAGNSYVVHVNDKIGDEGGYVVDILKHKVLVRLPDTDSPVEMTLAPDTLPIGFASTS